MAHVFRIMLLGCLGFGLPAVALAQPAFPGAEGFGAGASGGRGGAVLIVTTLDASGPGSLQAALNVAGPRIIVFEVSGVIEGDVHIPHGDVTIAGQTAPGAGITIHGHLYTTYDDPYGNFIIRHIRVRPPAANADWPADQHDSIQFSQNVDVILDHVSVSHGIDETIDMWNGARRVTIQWSAITYPVIGGGHSEGDHNYGVINGPGGGAFTVHHTLFAHNRVRTPAIADGPAEVINNVVYNGREGFVHHNPATGDFNIIGNVYIDGPSASMSPLWFDPENDGPPSRYFVFDNLADDPGVFEGRFDNPYTTSGYADEYTFACCGITESHFVNQAFDFGATGGHRPITTDATTAVRSAVIEGAGAWPRDIVDRWAAEEAATRTGAWADRRPSDWLEGLTPGAAPADADRDGMADAWESANGLDPSDGGDHDTVTAGGYTAIEDYINDVAATLIGQDPPPPLPDGGGVDADAGSGGSDAGTSPGLDGGEPLGDGGTPFDGGSSPGADGGTVAPGDDGCGCATVGATSGGGGAFGLALLGLIALRRRR